MEHYLLNYKGTFANVSLDGSTAAVLHGVQKWQNKAVMDIVFPTTYFW